MTETQFDSSPCLPNRRRSDAAVADDVAATAGTRTPRLRPSNVLVYILCFSGALAVGLFLMPPRRSSSKTAVPAVVSGSLVCEEPVWDVGVVDATNGPTLDHDFLLHNASAAHVVTISRIEKNCGCLIAELPEPIDPRKSITLPVTLVVPPVAGPFRQRIAVLQENSAPLVLTIAGQRIVRRQLRWHPDVLTFGKVSRQSLPSRTLYVRWSDSSPVRISSISATDSSLTTTLKDAKKDGKVEIDVELNADAAFEADSAFAADVVIAFEDRQLEPLRVAVTASPNAGDSVFVDRIVVARLSPGDVVDQPILSREASGEIGKDVALISFSGPASIRAELIVDEAAEPVVRFSRDSDDRGTGLVNGTLRLSASRDSGIFDVPVTAFNVDTR